jgi:hypothetical protein
MTTNSDIDANCILWFQVLQVFVGLGKKYRNVFCFDSDFHPIKTKHRCCFSSVLAYLSHRAKLGGIFITLQLLSPVICKLSHFSLFLRNNWPKFMVIKTFMWFSFHSEIKRGYYDQVERDCHGHDYMVVGFTSTC